MAVSDYAYGTSEDVAKLVPRYAASGGTDFDTNTRPTKAHVEALIDQVSAVVNSILSTQGFDIPVAATATIVIASLTFFVSQEVAQVAEGINGSGRFGPTTKNPGNTSIFGEILRDVKRFIEGGAVGFERLGAVRSYPASAGVGYRDTDMQGDPTFPVFQRDSFGPDNFNIDQDAE